MAQQGGWWIIGFGREKAWIRADGKRKGLGEGVEVIADGEGGLVDKMAGHAGWRVHRTAGHGGLKPGQREGIRDHEVAEQAGIVLERKRRALGRFGGRFRHP